MKASLIIAAAALLAATQMPDALAQSSKEVHKEKHRESGLANSIRNPKHLPPHSDESTSGPTYILQPGDAGTGQGGANPDGSTYTNSGSAAYGHYQGVPNNAQSGSYGSDQSGNAMTQQQENSQQMSEAVRRERRLMHNNPNPTAGSSAGAAGRPKKQDDTRRAQPERMNNMDQSQDNPGMDMNGNSDDR